ncbi:SPFH/Band 7/PHB domain protein [Candidatus Gracilibacteria bacterium]|nr:SPFH/Band 7/PHB domain protein [Candidatus Gracilibacteria bacterium]
MPFIFILLVFVAFVVPLSVKKINQGQEGLVEFLGKYQKKVGPGLTFLIPGIQTIQKVDIREQVITVPEQQIITMDNVSMAVDGVIYVQITDPYQATYDVNNVFMAVVSLAQTSLRSVLGTMSLDETLSNRETINGRLLETLDRETAKWGVKVLRVEIKRLDPPDDIQDAMSKQMKAEREKRAQILEAEGYKQSLITKSQGDKQSKILEAEGERESDILRAQGEANAEIALAEAHAKALELESQAAVAYFKGAAITKEQLKVIEGALGQNTKYILDSDILAGVSKIFGNAK